MPFPIHNREVGFAYKEHTTPTKTLQSFIDFYTNYTPEVTQ